MRYTIKPGDTLSEIAERFYGTWTLFPMIWDANRDHMRGKDASEIYPGEVLDLPESALTIDPHGDFIAGDSFKLAPRPHC